MRGPGVGDVEPELTVFVFEHVTGGGMAGLELPASLAAEGAAMRRAIVGDFAAVPGVRVVTTIDARLPEEVTPGVEVRRIADLNLDWFGALVVEADYTLLIAPESDDSLETTAALVEILGGRTIGSSSKAASLAGDKLALGHLLERLGVPTPPTRAIESSFADLPSDWPGPIVVKPRYGAGSVDTFVVEGGRRPPRPGGGRAYVAQPFLPGEPMSASFLVDLPGRPTLLAVGRQEIGVDPDGRISYRGGTVPSGPADCPAEVVMALRVADRAVRKPGIRGFAGVDFLLDDQGRATVLEINPRPTTSYVGLARLYPPGTIAGAWLAAAEGPLLGTEWPDRLRLDPHGPAVTFDADGTIREAPGAESP